MKVGDYVRTKKGIITKIEKCKNGTSDKLTTKETGIILDLEKWFKDDCVKSSPNIIDLIEVGDYVNGHKVIYTIGNIYKKIYVEYVNMDELLEIKLEQIKSIVTKEQFENMKYRILGETNEKE